MWLVFLMDTMKDMKNWLTCSFPEVSKIYLENEEKEEIDEENDEDEDDDENEDDLEERFFGKYHYMVKN